MKTKGNELIYWNGRVLPAESWRPDITSDAFRYGAGFFESIRVSKGRIYFWDAHYDRMRRGAGYWQVGLPGSGELYGAMMQYIAAHPADSGKLRIQFNVEADRAEPDCLAVMETGEPGYILNEEGWNVGIYRQHAKQPGEHSLHKSNNRDVYLMARRWMTAEGYDEALVLNPSGSVSDGTVTNLFWLENGRWYTPPVSSGGLPGVMRQFLLDRAEEWNVPIAEAETVPGQLQHAEAVFMTNAIRGIRWVRQVTDGGRSAHLNRTPVEVLHDKLAAWEREIISNPAAPLS